MTKENRCSEVVMQFHNHEAHVFWKPRKQRYVGMICRRNIFSETLPDDRLEGETLGDIEQDFISKVVAVRDK